MGISIVNEVCLTGKEKLVVIPLESYFPRRTYGAVTRRGKFLTPQAQAFLDGMSTFQCSKLPYKLAVAHSREDELNPNELDPRHLPTNIDDLDSQPAKSGHQWSKVHDQHRGGVGLCRS